MDIFHIKNFATYLKKDKEELTLLFQEQLLRSEGKSTLPKKLCKNMPLLTFLTKTQLSQVEEELREHIK